MSVIAVIILLFLIGIYVELPFWTKCIIIIINFFTPDPIPIIDEMIMIGGLFCKLEMICDALKGLVDWILENKFMIILRIGIGIVCWLVIRNLL